MAKALVKENFFISYKMIYDQPVGGIAKSVYIYLCQCADNIGQSFPSRKTIAEKCGFSVRSVVNAFNELIRAGLLTKVERFMNNRQSSNRYTVHEKPISKSNDVLPVQEMHTKENKTCTPRCARDARPPVQDLHTELEPKELDLFNKREGGKAAATHPPQKEVYGEFKKIKLAQWEYDQLIKTFGHDKTMDYIGRIDRHKASEGKKYYNDFATILKWIHEDNRKSKDAGTKAALNATRFSNFTQRSNDYEKIEKMERELLFKSLNDSAISQGDSQKRGPDAAHEGDISLKRQWPSYAEQCS